MLTLHDVHVDYATASVLRGVDLEVGDSEVVALLGRNGMGKTTLVRTVCGLRPPTLTGGTVELLGMDISNLPSHVISRRGIGLVPQGRRVFGSLTVDENLRIVARGDGEDGWTRDRVYALFPRLADRSQKWAGTLSGGEQQMLAIGRALMTNPRLLVMDEPSEGLAPTVLDVIRGCLRQLKKAGMAVLVVEQNVDLALSFADRVYILGADGAMVWSGTAARLNAHPDLFSEHLGV